MQWPGWNNSSGRSVVTEDSRINAIYSFPIVDIRDINSHFEHAVPVTSCSPKYGVDIIQRLLGLLVDRPESLFTGLRIDGELAGDKYESVVLYRLRIMTGRLRCVRGIDLFDLHGQTIVRGYSVVNTIIAGNCSQTSPVELAGNAALHEQQ